MYLYIQQMLISACFMLVLGTKHYGYILAFLNLHPGGGEWGGEQSHLHSVY